MKGGKVVRTGGLFAKGANTKRSVCLDAPGGADTVVQLEAADDEDAKGLAEAFTALATAVAQKTGLC